MTNKNFIRINSRIKVEHHSFAKSEAKRLSKKLKRDVTEAEVHRIMMDFYIKNHNKVLENE